MFLDEDQNNTPPANAAAQPERQSSGISADILRRDISCWYEAILYRSWLIVAIAILFAGGAFAYRYFFVPKSYSSSCALIRQEVADVRHSDLPLNYSPIQVSVMFNMIRGSICLDETARRLNLNATYEQMFRTTSVQRAEKNSNYFFVSAIAGEPQLAADIANTLAAVFLEEYKKMIRINLEDTLNSSIRNLNALKTELDTLQVRLAEHYLSALRKRVADTEIQLAETPQEVMVYSEKSSAGDKSLTDARLELEKMLQTYTEKNPVVIKQRLLIQQLEKENRNTSEVITRVLSGRNQEYVAINLELSRLKSELQAAERLLKNNEDISSLRLNFELLRALPPQMNTLRDQIDRKKEQLLKQESIHKTLSHFLERSYSDITVHDAAKAPESAMPRKVTLVTLAGGFFGFLFAFAAILLLEFFNLSVRSRTDIEKALRIGALGIIPHFEVENRAHYYSALQEAVNNGKRFFGGDNAPPGVKFVLVAPEAGATGFFDSDVSRELQEILAVKENLNCKIIRDAGDDDAVGKNLINDVLYSLEDELPETGEGQNLYFKLDDLAFLASPSPRQLERLRSLLSSYDLVIWESFPPEKHAQLFDDLFDFADMLVIPARCAKSSKLSIGRFIAHLHGRRDKIFGLLYDVRKSLGWKFRI